MSTGSRCFEPEASALQGQRSAVELRAQQVRITEIYSIIFILFVIVIGITFCVIHFHFSADNFLEHLWKHSFVD